MQVQVFILLEGSDSSFIPSFCEISIQVGCYQSTLFCMIFYKVMEALKNLPLLNLLCQYRFYCVKKFLFYCPISRLVWILMSVQDFLESITCKTLKKNTCMNDCVWHESCSSWVVVTDLKHIRGCKTVAFRRHNWCLSSVSQKSSFRGWATEAWDQIGTAKGSVILWPLPELKSCALPIYHIEV